MKTKATSLDLVGCVCAASLYYFVLLKTKIKSIFNNHLYIFSFTRSFPHLFSCALLDLNRALI